MHWWKNFSKNNQNKMKMSEFDYLMQLANEICEVDPEGLSNLLKLILRPLQAEQMLTVAENPPHTAHSCLGNQNIFTGTDISYLFFEYKHPALPINKYEILLATDIVFVFPWRRDRICNALAKNGDDRQRGKWQQLRNHRITLWMPWGIGFVHGGNHSITAGIICGEGKVTPTEVFDMSALLDRLQTDGLVFADKTNGKIIAKVKNQRTAAAFEIGRLMREHNINPLKMKIP